jgi:hypothetical protein
VKIVNGLLLQRIEMFSIHDRVSWVEFDKGDHTLLTMYETLTGTIVSEEPHDHYLVKRDYDGKCQILCYRKLRLIDV